MERRKTPRINLSWMAHLEVNGIDYSCNLKNLNNGGALLSMKENSSVVIHEDSVGKDALLTIKYDKKTDRSFKGNILRITKNNKAHIIAIEFVFNQKS